ncbi:aldehyde dehydrogenase family protein [Pelagibacterium luteolum]|uniref:Acyl-CoA reductase n=1 Tax=Pelagibacterium luteolum TaxID=440168 RepID=A0A1G7SXE3_9HYPH|nr:aldehyde dehydrogenase family protein [Pelagibacterium luteolum]SDG27454.1 Acyl-CoA reductase [Pelagibacterium luteolum]
MDALNHIAGADRAAQDNTWIDSIDPATGAAIARYAPGDTEMAEEAAAAASRAFFDTTWSSDARLREGILRRFADRLEARSDELVALLSLENGKLKHEAKGELISAISEARFYAGVARVPHGRSSEVIPGGLSILSREAAGVAAIIVPWNAPVTLLVRSLAPALAAGCTVVIKPANQTALINRAILDALLADPEIPKGVINIVNERGTEVGQALVASSNVHVISFTGSSRTGKAIMVAAAPTMKRLSLELGGKSPAIVFPDADLERAVAELTFGALSVAGQFCMCASRFLVHRDVQNELKRRLAERFAALRVGPASNAESQMGPVIDEANRQRLLGLIRGAHQDGELIVSGRPLEGNGSFLTPTLVSVDNPGSHLVQDELFGPIITFETFASEEEALRKAHATVYGLAASVHTSNLERGHRMARRLRFGTVWLNCHRRQFAEAEVGGFGESGLGRLHGVEGLSDFMETKHTFLQHS